MSLHLPFGCRLSKNSWVEGIPTLSLLSSRMPLLSWKLSCLPPPSRASRLLFSWKTVSSFSCLLPFVPLRQFFLVPFPVRYLFLFLVLSNVFWTLFPFPFSFPFPSRPHSHRQQPCCPSSTRISYREPKSVVSQSLSWGYQPRVSRVTWQVCHWLCFPPLKGIPTI